MEFAERMLKKYGWDADKGLGKDNQGMKAALKPVLKFDSRGVSVMKVGCNQKDEYSNEFKWWEHSFDRAAKKISGAVGDEDKPVKKRKRDDAESTTKTVYSRFTKGSILTGNIEESVRVEEETVESESTPTRPTDEELLRICGGRTAHKGARHGIKMNGKLQRLQEQEERDQSPSPLPSSSSSSSLISLVEKTKKKKKKSLDSDE